MACVDDDHDDMTLESSIFYAGANSFARWRSNSLAISLVMIVPPTLIQVMMKL